MTIRAADQVWKKVIKEKGLSFFTEEVLGFQNAPHQVEWYSVLDNKKLKKIATAAPRGHTKSTCFTVNYPLYRITEDSNVRILIVTNAESQGQGFLREIVGRIERDQSYVDFAGQLKPQIPERWTNREIIIDRDNYGLKDPTISTVGVGGTILSKRADEIICDDILNPENTKTVEQRAKLKEWFYQVLLPVLRPGGRIIFVGTVWHPQDLLSEILGDPGWDYRKKFQAVISWGDKLDMWQEWYGLRMAGTPEAVDIAEKYLVDNRDEMHQGVDILWKDNFTFEMLYTLWRANRLAFEKAYQNNIISREDQKFKEEWLERAKERGANMRLIRELNPDQRKEMKILTGGIDLAAGEEETNDDNAMVALGMRRLDDMVVLLGLDRGKFSPAAWRNTIVERHGGFRHDRIIVESNGYQKAISRDLAEKNLPIVAFTTGGEKFDPYIGVESLAILFENNRMILPYDKSDPDTIAKIDQLVDELRSFPIGHTGDSAMALWFAFTAMRDLGSGAQSGWLSLVQKDAQNAQAPNISWWVKQAQSQQQ